jgi:hypothetical protein
VRREPEQGVVHHGRLRGTHAGALARGLPR